MFLILKKTVKNEGFSSGADPPYPAERPSGPIRLGIREQGSVLISGSVHF